MSPSICAGSMRPYGWATYRTCTPRSGKMSRAMRLTARRPINATATTVVKSEIGRCNANDTKFIVTPQCTLARPDGRARLDCREGKIAGQLEEMRPILPSKCSSPEGPTTSIDEQNLDGEPSQIAGSLRAPTIDHHRTSQSDASASSKFTFTLLKPNWWWGQQIVVGAT